MPQRGTLSAPCGTPASTCQSPAVPPPRITAPRSEPATAEASATTDRSAPAAERSAPQQRTLHNAAIEASALVAGDAASASTATPRASLFDVAALAGGCVFVVVGAVAAARRTVRLWTYSAVDSPPAV